MTTNPTQIAQDITAAVMQQQLEVAVDKIANSGFPKLIRKHEPIKQLCWCGRDHD